LCRKKTLDIHGVWELIVYWIEGGQRVPRKFNPKSEGRSQERDYEKPRRGFDLQRLILIKGQKEKGKVRQRRKEFGKSGQMSHRQSKKRGGRIKSRALRRFLND